MPVRRACERGSAGDTDDLRRRSGDAVYADPGTDVVVDVAGIPAATFPIFSAALSGSLIDVPSRTRRPRRLGRRGGLAARPRDIMTILVVIS